MRLRQMYFLYDGLLDRLIYCPWVCSAGKLSPRRRALEVPPRSLGAPGSSATGR